MLSRCRIWPNDESLQKSYENLLRQREAKILSCTSALHARLLRRLYERIEELEVEWETLRRQRDEAFHADLGMSSLRQMQCVFDECFSRGKSLKEVKQEVVEAKKAMEEANQAVGSNLVYGEIEFLPFAIALRKLSRRYGLDEGGNFYDIGHGTGKPVLAASLCHPFQKVGGVEIMDCLFAHSERNLATWRDHISAKLPQQVQETEVVLAHGDCLDFKVLDWRDATVLFANSTCFPAKFFRRIAASAEECAEGCFFISFTTPIIRYSGCWTLLEKASYKMSWGMASVYISVRNDRPPRTPPLSKEELKKLSTTGHNGGAKGAEYFSEDLAHHSMRMRTTDPLGGCMAM